MISIAQISDTHLLCPVKVGETDIVKQRINNLKRCVDSINNLDPQPDIIIHTGDVTQNGTVEEYTIADSILIQVTNLNEHSFDLSNSVSDIDDELQGGIVALDDSNNLSFLPAPESFDPISLIVGTEPAKGNDPIVY